jgi:GT2 family glycosyltransferase
MWRVRTIEKENSEGSRKVRMSSFRPWKIVHVQLESPLPDIESLSEIGGLYIVFWMQGIALGHAKVPAEQLPLSAAALALVASKAVAPAVGDCLFDCGFKARLPGVPKHALCDSPPDLAGLITLANPLSALREQLVRREEPAATPLTISVAVCTRERPEPLRRCLTSLLELRDPPVEIIVVDNAPQTELTRQLTASLPGVRYVEEPRAGLDNARNAALCNCTGDIIAFADDDVVVEPTWTRRILRGFSDPRVMAVTGLVLPAELESESQMIFETFWSFNRGYRPIVYGPEFMKETAEIGPPATEIGAGANMAFRREVRQLVGLFDERLDVGAAGCNGDSEYWYRILAGGWKCRYEPTAIAHHYHRREMDALRRQIYFYMRGYSAALLVQNERHHHFGNIRRLVRTFPRFWHHFRCLLRGDVNGRRRMLDREILGCLDGVKYYWTNRHLPRHQ